MTNNLFHLISHFASIVQISWEKNLNFSIFWLGYWHRRMLTQKYGFINKTYSHEIMCHHRNERTVSRSYFIGLPGLFSQPNGSIAALVVFAFK